MVESIVSFYRQIDVAESDFDRRIKKLKESGDVMSQREFEKWEDAVSDELKYAQREMKNCVFGPLEAERIVDAMILPGMIEIQSGRYYIERSDALIQAIRTADNESSKRDIKDVEDFYPTVLKYIQMRFISKNEIIDHYGSLIEYAKEREYAHNRVIKSLNGLNSLARWYHTRSFTPRNFLPSDTLPDQMRQARIEVVENLHERDREIVTYYCFAAFQSKIEERERRQMRDQLARA